MTTAVVVAVFSYPLVAAMVLSWLGRRGDAAFRRGMYRVLRGRVGVGSEGGQAAPPGLSALAGVERADTHPADAPPAPMPLAGAACPPAVVSARPQCVRLGGAL